jgi:hypothetical protein
LAPRHLILSGSASRAQLHCLSGDAGYTSRSAIAKAGVSYTERYERLPHFFPSDFRQLRIKVNKAALNGRLSAYYLDSTWETKLPGFRTAAEPNVYQRLPDGTAVLDGYPIVWTDVLTPYGTADNADKPIAVFAKFQLFPHPCHPCNPWSISTIHAQEPRRPRTTLAKLPAIACLYYHPAWESPATIRDSLLHVTPLASTMAEVRSVAERKGWAPSDLVDNYVPLSTGTGLDVTAFSAEIRHDPFPYRTSVQATWEFNRSNQLVNISVLRHE